MSDFNQWLLIATLASYSVGMTACVLYLLKRRDEAGR